jgi:hypothetical protein
MVYPMRVALAVAAAAVALTGCGMVQQTAAAKASGRAAVDRFHGLVEAGDFASVYNAGHPTLRQSLSGDEAARRLSEVHDKLGRVVEVNDGCWTFLTTPAGVTLRAEYEVAFAGGEAWETYDWRFDGDEAQMLAYAVETGYRDGRPDWEVALAPRNVRPNATTCSDDDSPPHWWER